MSESINPFSFEGYQKNKLFKSILRSENLKEYLNKQYSNALHVGANTAYGFIALFASGAIDSGLNSAGIQSPILDTAIKLLAYSPFIRTGLYGLRSFGQWRRDRNLFPKINLF